MEEYDTSADAALERIQAALNSYGSESPYCESTIDPNYDVARIRGRLNLAGELLEALEYITSESGCEHFTTGLGSCYQQGMREDAEDWADKVCFPCKAHKAIAKAHGEAQDG